MWAHVATRVDSPIRYWLVTQACRAAELDGVNKNVPEVAGLSIRACYYDSDGNFNWDAVSFEQYMDGLLERFGREPPFFLDLYHLYEPRARAVVYEAAAISRAACPALSDADLGGMFDQYVSTFLALGPAIVFTFAVDRLYERRYPEVFDRLWRHLQETDWIDRFATCSERKVLARGQEGVVAGSASLLREVVEAPDGVTDGERKRTLVAAAAKKLMKEGQHLRSVLRFWEEGGARTVAELLRNAVWADQIVCDLQTICQEFGWIVPVR